MRDPAPGIAESNDDTLFFTTRNNIEVAPRPVQHGAFTVLGQIEKDLEQTLPVRPYRGKRGVDVHRKGNILFGQRRFDDNAQFLKQ